MSYLSDLLGSSYVEGMSEEDISKAVEKAVKAREKQAEADLTKIRNAFNKASSEVAEYKHKLADHMSDEEKKATEQAELLKQLQAENEAFKKQSAIADNRAKFISLGFDEDSASKSAEALYNGDLASVFNGIKSVWDTKEKEIRAGVMKDAPTPPAGGSGPAVTRDSIMSIKDPIERQAAIAEHRDLFGI